jgi:putative tricarboxylic transport membrane protein
MASIVGGHVTLGINSVSELEPQVAAGKLRWIGISSDEPVAGIDAPTFKSGGVDLVLGNWRGVLGAPGLSDADKKKLVAVFDEMAKSEAWKKKLKEKTWMDNYLSGDAFDTYLTKEKLRVTEILKSVGLVK